MTDSRTPVAVALALASSAILSLIDSYIAAIADESGLWQFHVMRTAMALPLLLAGAILFKIRIRPVSVRRIALRSTTVAAGLLIYFAALGILPVAQAGAGLFSAPIWVAVFAIAIFGQRVGPAKMVAMAFGFGGVLLILQPDLDGVSAWSALPLAAGALYGLGMLMTRHWCAEDSALTLAAGTFTVMGVFGAAMLAALAIWPVEIADADPVTAFLLRGWVEPSGQLLALTAMQAVGSVVAVSLISQAYRIGETPVVSVVEYSFLVFAALWGAILLGQRTDPLAMIGIAIVIAAGVAMSALGGRTRAVVAPARQ